MRRYAAAIPAPAPAVWGWHAYEDGWDRGARRLVPAAAHAARRRSRRTAQVWLTEQGGIVRRHIPGDDGRTEQSAQAAAADLAFLLARRPAADRRVKRFYLYQWRASRRRAGTAA